MLNFVSFIETRQVDGIRSHRIWYCTYWSHSPFPVVSRCLGKSFGQIEYPGLALWTYDQSSLPLLFAIHVRMTYYIFSRCHLWWVVIAVPRKICLQNWSLWELSSQKSTHNSKILYVRLMNVGFLLWPHDRRKQHLFVFAYQNFCRSTKQNVLYKNSHRTKSTRIISSWISSCFRKRVSHCFRVITPILDPYSKKSDSNCENCSVRHKMQQKYLNEAHELYDEFFHIILLPLMTEEVRGPEKLKEFSKMLVEPYISPQD